MNTKILTAVMFVLICNRYVAYFLNT